ncbi:hypothetical protein IJG79_00700 [Candidatus Saccharibacteria bacterium]|nr:hypothetical protein [Candidatus Saccharibacteria bacterium]
MNIYISGISGTGLGPLAIMAKDAGLGVCGSDLSEGAVSGELRAKKIVFSIGKQDGSFLQKQYNDGNVDWFVYTSALPDNHPELLLAKKLGIRISKRDELIAYLVEKQDLKMVAIAGTHGKTTTTSMIIWAALNLGLPISYLVGTTLPFAEAGHYNPNSKFLIYEADEYDRNFLHFHPWLSIITTISYDHPDIYKTKLDYLRAFMKFESQSDQVIRGSGIEGEAVVNNETYNFSDKFSLPGKARRYDAGLAMQAIFEMAEEADLSVAAENLITGLDIESYKGQTVDEALITKILDKFPGVGRRYERITDGVYTDYGHHPEEIAATIEMAKEDAKINHYKGVVAIYEPHQNTRQHDVIDGYKDAFSGASMIFWLPTYLTREDPSLAVLKPEDFISTLSNQEIAKPAKLDDELAKILRKLRDDGYLILLMTAGPADSWYRKVFNG